MRSDDVLDLHLTRLAGWFVQTLGKAFLFGALVAFVLGGIGVLVGSTGLLFIGVGLAPIASAWYLVTADAPMPVEVDED